MTGGLDLPRPSAAVGALGEAADDVPHAGGDSRHHRHVAAGYYFAMRPVILRIAVGPANSDDIKVVQALTQAFTQIHGHIRLRPVQTDGAAASARRWPTARSISPSSAAISMCRRMRRPWRRCARTSRCCGCPRPEGQGQEGRRRRSPRFAQLAGRRIGVVGRTPANVNLLKVILQQYGVDPAKVEIVQFPATEVADAIRSQKADAYLAAGPVNSKITADAIAASTRDGGAPTFLAIDSAEAIAQNHPNLRSLRNSRRRLRRLARPARRRGEDHQLLAPHRRAQGSVGYRRSPPSPGNCLRSGSR